MEKAIFAAGCFWGVQLNFDKQDGVVSTTVGYIGGHVENPTYEVVCMEETHHAEAVEVIFDPEIITFGQLLDLFWHLHDPTTLNRQGPDSGSQYRSAIYYCSEEQRDIAEKSRALCNASDLWPDPVVTEITRAVKFWSAEDCHQKYLEKRNIQSACHRGHL